MTPYRVKAVNTAVGTENKIHSDEAAKYGFRAGLVPGTTVYGYMTVPVVSRFGREWLDHGRMELRLEKPFYDGEMVEVRIQEDGRSLQVSAADERGEVRAVATATLEAGEYTIVPPRGELPAERPPASEATMTAGRVLGSLKEQLPPWPGDPLEIYRGTGALAHPEALLTLANQIVSRNFVISPWIHTASDVRCRRAAVPGESVTVRGAIREVYERKGHHFMKLDVCVVAEDGGAIQEILHTAIWKMRQS